MTKSEVIYQDGSLTFDGGVDSIKVPTIQSPANPNGLGRNQLAWMINGSVRDGGISPRAGWLFNGKVHDGSALFQGASIYDPDGEHLYIMASIGGHIYLVDPNNGNAADLSVIFSLFNPPDEPFAFFCQAENFMIIQAGDSTTLPLFWDGFNMRRSNGITGALAGPNINELPAALSMDYYMGRVWYAQGRQYTAGDIVGGPSGTPTYNFRDSVLKVTENPLALGGDGFVVPSNDGTIRALKHGANIDAALGQGRLFVFTRRAVYALQVPVTRTQWIAATDNNQPLQTVVQLVNGSVNDRSVVAVNGDLFYQSLEPGIRSLMQSVRYFTQWGNIMISANEERILQFVNRALLKGSSGMYFNNFMFQTSLPRQTPQGIVHDAIIPMDFIPISSFGSTLSPVWLGMNEGIGILQLLAGDFGGRERGFAMTVSSLSSQIQLWEFTTAGKEDYQDNRIGWSFETPAYTWAGSIGELNLKRLVMAEIGVDRLIGTVYFKLQWRPDNDACWYNWHQWKECSPKNSAETVDAPITYPLIPCTDSYRATITTPRPPQNCAAATGRPADIGFQFQCRLTIRGYCRIRSFQLHAQEVERQQYNQITCGLTTFEEIVTPPLLAPPEPDLQPPVTPGGGITITTDSPLPNATIGVHYSVQLETAQPIVQGRTWVLTIGTPPPGTFLNGATGVISGKPVLIGTTGITWGFTVTVIDAQGSGSKHFTITTVLP